MNRLRGKMWLILLVLPLGIGSVQGAGNDQDPDRTRERPREVQDLRYGVALYQFFQHAYFDALTELMVGDLTQDFQHHAEQARLLQGGISLSYGLVEDAESIFTRLLQDADPEQRNLAWFYLAKLRYQLGQEEKARAALERVEQLAQEELSAESDYMSASMFLHDGQLARAEQAILNLEPDSHWLPYYYFNRGVLQSEAGELQQALQAFQRLHELPARDSEIKHLRDRAYTAAGFALLAAGEYAAAQQAFRSVRLDSLLVGQALLGYGWAAAQQEDYQQALSPWQELRQNSLMEASAQESLLAVPFAYEKLEAPGAALSEYKKSVGLLETELGKIEAAITLYSEAPVEQLFELEQITAAPVQDWFTEDDLLPLDDYAPFLAYLITRQRFQDQVRQLRELRQLDSFLEQGRERLALTRVVLEERTQIWHDKVEGSQERELEQRYRELSVGNRHLQQQLRQAREAADGLLLLEEGEIALWQRLRNAEKSVERLAGLDEDVSQQRRKLQLLRGLLLWQADQAYPDRIWQLQKQQRELERVMAQTEPALQRVKQISVAPDDQGFAARIDAMGQRLAGQQQQLEQQLLIAERSIREAAVAELEQQRGRLNSYLGQARLAIARLYDLGSRDLGSTDFGSRDSVSSDQIPTAGTDSIAVTEQ